MHLAKFKQEADIFAVIFWPLPEPSLMISTRLTRLNSKLCRDVSLNVLNIDVNSRGTKVFECAERFSYSVVHSRLQMVEEVVGYDPDSDSFDAVLKVASVVLDRNIGATIIFRVGTSDNVEHDSAVLDSAGQGTYRIHTPGQRDDPIVTHSPYGGADTGDAVNSSRQANGTAGVGAYCPIASASRNGRTGPPA